MKRLTAAVCAVLIAFCAVTNACAFGDNALSFKEGKFKILVLSDTQDDQNPAYDMINLITQAIKQSDPDLIVFTGDLVEDSRIGDIGIDDEPFREGVVVKDVSGEINHEKTLENVKAAADAVLSVFQASGVPFALIQGNNDYKCSVTNEEWLEIYSHYSNCLTFDKSDDKDGRIDYNLEINGSDGNMKFNLWMLDTGRGGINDDQIEWYKTESDKYTAANGGTSIPAIAFQHIQTDDIGNLFEKCKITDDGSRAIGTEFYRLNKEIANGTYTFAYEPGKTSDEFKAWKQEGDVIAAFFGHQHVEGFSGKVDGIELGFTYGCEMAKTGPYGYRLITLHENDVKNYDNELYTYQGKVKLGTAKFEKQIDEPYPTYDNNFDSFFAGVGNIFTAIKSVIIGIFA